MSRAGGCKGQSIEVRLLEKIEYELNSGCWLFTGCLHNGSGYGLIWEGRKQRFAHRVAFELWNGPIRAADQVRHSCDTRPCCNPTHLTAGPQIDNILDCIQKDRHARGERQGFHRLSDDLVRAILADKRGPSEIAREIGVSPMTVSDVKRRVTWKHVDAPV